MLQAGELTVWAMK